ncbi:MAG: cytidylate kinase-like family protein [Deltaproteobacteria bacterium]|nr:cytidylate kinase-like family protein [Deltaproteobacteria bacterium]
MPNEGVEQIVNRQVEVWNKERRTRDSAGLQGDLRPCITISREFGSLGAKVGEQVAERLGFTFDDQDVITRIAETEHVRRAVLESVDERVRDRMTEWIAEQFGGGRLTSSRFLKALTSVILTIGHHGKAVIIGRGSQFLLKPEKTLRVRAYAPTAFRIQQIMAGRGLSRSEAEALVDEVDNQRRDFYAEHFNKDWADPGHYDLLVNMATYSVEHATQIVVEAFNLRFGLHG